MSPIERDNRLSLFDSRISFYFQNTSTLSPNWNSIRASHKEFRSKWFYYLTTLSNANLRILFSIRLNFVIVTTCCYMGSAYSKSDITSSFLKAGLLVFGNAFILKAVAIASSWIIPALLKLILRILYLLMRWSDALFFSSFSLSCFFLALLECVLFLDLFSSYFFQFRAFFFSRFNIFFHCRRIVGIAFLLCSLFFHLFHFSFVFFFHCHFHQVCYRCSFFFLSRSATSYVLYTRQCPICWPWHHICVTLGLAYSWPSDVYSLHNYSMHWLDRSPDMRLLCAQVSSICNT